MVQWGRGLGVIDSPDVPGGCFVLFSNSVGIGYRSLPTAKRLSLLTGSQDSSRMVTTFERCKSGRLRRPPTR